MTVSAWRSPSRQPRFQRPINLLLIGLISAFNFYWLTLLVEALLNGHSISGPDLVVNAFKIWLTNILIFALWYWQLDGGGPWRRRGSNSSENFLFLQRSLTDRDRSAWRPGFLDYLFISFTNAATFGPNDTLPLTVAAHQNADAVSVDDFAHHGDLGDGSGGQYPQMNAERPCGPARENIDTARYGVSTK